MTREEAEKATLDPIDYALQAVKASGKKVLVAGSIGPLIDKPGCEYNPEYLNRLSLNEIVNWHHDKFKLLANSDCDLLAIRAGHFSDLLEISYSGFGDISNSRTSSNGTYRADL